MKRKIIITESQYNKLQEFLFETPYRRLYSKIQENDVIEIINKGVPSKFKVRIFANDYIIMDGITKNVSNYVFAINKDGLWKSNFEAKKILKNDERKSNKNIDTWPSFTMVITSFKLIRGNNVIDVADIEGSIPEPTTEPEPINTPDEISKEILMDPNTPGNFDKLEEPEEENFDEMIDNIEQEYKSDDIFRNALYKQPSFLERLSAEIRGVKPKGSGIIIANQLVNSYRDKGSNDYLNADFRKPFFARFKSLEDYELEYDIEGKLGHIRLIKDGEREAKVGNANDKNQRKLEYKDKNEKFSILVTKNISTEEIPNYFLCYISTYSIENGNLIKNKSIPVKLQFLDSTGFKVKNS